MGTTSGFSGSGEPGGRQLPVNAVQGETAVASTTPGRILPAGDPTPGKAPAAPKLLVLPNGGPSVALKPGKPNVPPANPGQNGGRKTAVPASVPTFGPDGARIIAGALPSRVAPKYICVFGK